MIFFGISISRKNELMFFLLDKHCPAEMMLTGVYTKFEECRWNIIDGRNSIPLPSQQCVCFLTDVTARQ